MIDNNCWRYYNHALIPNCAPHETPDLSSVYDKSIWKDIGKKAVFVRWTSEFDNNLSRLVYIIQDSLMKLDTIKKSHRRKYKGIVNFEVFPLILLNTLKNG